MDWPKFVCFRPYGLAQENGRLRLARNVRLWPTAVGQNREMSTVSMPAFGKSGRSALNSRNRLAE